MIADRTHKTVRLVLCRHTQTDDNADGRYTGHNDIPLNDVGLAQADALARRISAIPNVVAVVSSDLVRARTLAERIAQVKALKPEFTTDLREVDLGKMAGALRTESTRLFPEDRYRTSNPDFDYRDIGGEDSMDVLARHFHRLHHVRWSYGIPVGSAEPLPTVVLVGHGTAFRRVFVTMLGLVARLHEQGDCDEIVYGPAPRPERDRCPG